MSDKKKITLTGTKYELLNELLSLCDVDTCTLDDANWNKVVNSVVAEYEVDDIYPIEEILYAAESIASSKELFERAIDALKWETLQVMRKTLETIEDEND